MDSRSMQIGNRFTSILLSIVILSLLLSCSPEEEKADLILVNGNIITVDDQLPEAQAIAVKEDKILAVGNNEEIKKFAGDNTQTINLAGKLVIPGFIESHAHFIGLGKSLINLDLKSANNWDEIIAMVSLAAQNTSPGEWIVGRGWHQEKLDPPPFLNVEGYPLHNVLSQVSPFNPVMLSHASGHAVFANKRAMNLAGIDTSTKDPAGGRIVRDSLKNAIGVFEEEAEMLIYNEYKKHIDKKSEAELKNDKLAAIKLAVQECLENGITTVHDAGAYFNEVNLFKELADNNELGVRLYVMLGENYSSLVSNGKNYLLNGYGGNFLTVRAIKKYVDGALGSRGAWMLQPYNDLPGHSGLNVTTLEELENTANYAKENGFQLCIHAIGDRGNREALNIYERVLGESSAEYRWRIEHAQHLASVDVTRFSKLGIIAAMQGVHCTSDAVFVVKRLGEERAKRGAYVWRKLIESGALICNGTDAPVESVNTIKNYYSTVTRELNDGTAFYPEQKMTRMEALKSYTINGAYAAFEENIKGSITPGKLADFVVLSQNILTVPDEEILNTKIEKTIIGGKVVYTK
ncbi:MAG: amidohydrolase [Bacteroidetes bacterium]|nr:amidohydrolase [Bacteroidota bacterium]MBU1680029.1 amidohydrolase [Bacteroidota bacterium]